MSLNLRNMQYEPKTMAEEGVDLSVSFEGKTKFAPKIEVKYSVDKPWKFVPVAGAKGEISPAGLVYTEQFPVPSKLYNPYPSQLTVRLQAGSSSSDLGVLDVGMKAREVDSGDDTWVPGLAIRVAILHAAVKEMRSRKGLTQVELAERTGLHVSTISRAEGGQAVSEKTRRLLEAHL